MQKIGFCERYMLTTAVLNRTKELTRRLEKALERAVEEYEQLFGMPFSVSSQIWDEKKKSLSIWTPKSHIELKTRYKLGEVIAVAQSYKSIHEEMTNGNYGDSKYDAFRCAMVGNTPGWSNKMFVRPDLMPHQIQITDIKIERLQDISDEDCWKEGIIIKTIGDFGTYAGYGYGERRASSLDETFSTPREAFAYLIDRPGVGRKGLWESNPWVVVYEFKLIK